VKNLVLCAGASATYAKPFQKASHGATSTAGTRFFAGAQNDKNGTLSWGPGKNPGYSRDKREPALPDESGSAQGHFEIKAHP
jgi:hypothetical protein